MATLRGSKEAGGSPPSGKPLASPKRACVGGGSGMLRDGAGEGESDLGVSGGVRPRSGDVLENCGERGAGSGFVAGKSGGSARAGARVGMSDLGGLGGDVRFGTSGSGGERAIAGIVPGSLKGSSAVSTVTGFNREVEARSRVAPVTAGNVAGFAGSNAGATGCPEGSRNFAGGLGTSRGTAGEASESAEATPGNCNKNTNPAGNLNNLNVSERNRRFWEENVARTRNRERGVQLKHFPSLQGAREVKISEDLWHKAVDKMSNSLVGVVFGEKPNISRVRGFARARWGDPEGKKVTVALLNEGVFLFKFASVELKDETLYGGALTFNRKPLIFQEWSPDKSYECGSVKAIPIWIRLPGLRAHIQGEEEILSMVVSAIGRPLTTDGYTGDKSMMKFARVHVEVYADQEFPDEVTIVPPYGAKFVQKIEYEWRPYRCVNCSSFGHLRLECTEPLIEEEEVLEEESSEEEEGDHVDPEEVLGDVGKEWKNAALAEVEVEDDSEPNGVSVEMNMVEDGGSVMDTQVTPGKERFPSILDNILYEDEDLDHFEEEFKVVESKKKRKGKGKEKVTLKENEEEKMKELIAFATMDPGINKSGRDLRSNKGGTSTARGGFRGGTSLPRGGRGNKSKSSR